MAIIEVRNISKSFGSVDALSSIDLSVDKGELFGLIGPDGAGKTTLFKILTSLLIPDSGEALLQGLHTVKDYKKIRNIIGYMPGKFSLYQDLSIEENLSFFATIFGTTIKENYHLIEDIYSQIEPFKKRRAGKLSGGMKQKLALCCALIHEPEILFLDEPTTGVDAVSRAEFWVMLKRLKEKGITIFVSTPYMDEASKCERIALIQNGKILKVDTPDHIINDFDKPIYAIKASNYIGLLKDLRINKLTDTVEPFGEYLHWTTHSEIDKTQIISQLETQGFTDIELFATTANIEDVFLQLM